MDLARGVPADDTDCEDLRLPPALAGESERLLLCVVEASPFRDRVEVHNPALPHGGGHRTEELHGTLREVHNHAVNRSELREDILAVPLVDNDIRAVSPHVLPQQFDRRGVRIDRMNRLRGPGAGDEDRIRPDPGEHVHDDLAGTHLPGHAQPLRSEAG